MSTLVEVLESPTRALAAKHELSDHPEIDTIKFYTLESSRSHWDRIQFEEKHTSSKRKRSCSPRGSFWRAMYTLKGFFE